MPLELPGHSEMHPPHAPVRLQFCHEVLTPACPVANGRTCQPFDEELGTPRTGDRSRATDFNLCDLEVSETVSQTTANRLDFGKFRQRPQAGSSSASAKLLVLMPPSTPWSPL